MIADLNLLAKDEYARMAAKENFYWWHIGRRAILKSILKRHLKNNNLILDVGCGGGGNILFLKNFGEVIGLDPSPEALKFCQNRGFKKLISGMAEKIPHNDGTFDLATAFDVLEHLEDDLAALHEMKRSVKKGGLVMVTVPAMPFLWNPQDEYLGHKRRYRKEDLIEKFEKAGLEILEASYFVLPSVPAIMARRTLEKAFRSNLPPHSFDILLPKSINNFFVFLLKMEKLLLKFSPLPFGSSLYVLARR